MPLLPHSATRPCLVLSIVPLSDKNPHTRFIKVPFKLSEIPSQALNPTQFPTNIRFQNPHTGIPSNQPAVPIDFSITRSKLEKSSSQGPQHNLRLQRRCIK